MNHKKQQQHNNATAVSCGIDLINSGNEIAAGSLVDNRDEDRSELIALIGEHWWQEKMVSVYRPWLR